MIKRLAVMLFVSALALPVFAKKDKFKVMHAPDLSAALKSSTAPSVYDANNQETRVKEGTIPGSHLLSSYDKFDLAKELPSSKKTPLVFFCANTLCMASHEAADKAIGAGYKNVSVMVDGIQGWKKAGLPFDKVASK